MKLDLRFDEVLGSDVDVVWRALTDPTTLARWLTDNDFEARAGHRFALTDPPTARWDGRVACQVLELVPRRRMVWSWNAGTADEVDTRVVFELEPEATSTRLRLHHTGDAMPAQRQALRAGWTRSVDFLREVLGPGYARRVSLGAPRDPVFDAITTIDGLAGWWSSVRGSPVADGELRLAFPGAEELVVRVDRVRRPASVHWSCVDGAGGRAPVHGAVTFQLVELPAQRCELRFRHTGVAGQTVAASWDDALERLGAHVALSNAVP